MNKDRKRVLCGGLAFSDSEDMEMLHQYALEGWIFREMKGVHYILYKEEPQDLIFSYDYIKIKKEDLDDYVAFFREAGWSKIACKELSMHFFSAPSGTQAVHTDIKTRAGEYKTIAIWSTIVALISVPLTIYFVTTVAKNHGISLLIAGLLGGTAGCSTIMAIGTCMHCTHKRFTLFNFTFKQSTILFIVGLLFLLASKLMMEPYKSLAKWLLIFGAILVTGGVSWMFMTYRTFKDKKEIRKREGTL